MNQEPTSSFANSANNGEVVLDDEDIQRLARLLNELMEIDFYLKRNAEEASDD